MAIDTDCVDGDKKSGRRFFDAGAGLIVSDNVPLALCGAAGMLCVAVVPLPPEHAANASITNAIAVARDDADPIWTMRNTDNIKSAFRKNEVRDRRDARLVRARGSLPWARNGDVRHTRAISRAREKSAAMGDGDPRSDDDAKETPDATVEVISDAGVSRVPLDKNGRPLLPKEPRLKTALYHSPSASRAFLDAGKKTDATEELISDLGVSTVPVDRRRQPPPPPLPRGTSLYHSTIYSRALAIDVGGFDDDLDASVSMWYTENNDSGPLFEDRLPRLPEGLPAELRGAFVEIRVVDLDALASYVAHADNETKGVTRYIIPSPIANEYPRRVVTHGQESETPRSEPEPVRKKR